MESLFPIIRKYDFPKSVTEALRIVHIQCEKMSKNSLSISQELNQITEFVDDYVFGHPRSLKSKKVGSIQQMQIIQALIDYFSSDTDFSLLCSVFMVVFLAKGRQVDFKISTLSKLLSLNLGQGHKTLLNCAALWWTQQPPNSEHSTTLTHSIVQDYILLLPDTRAALSHIPTLSPLLAGILLTYFSELYAVPADSSIAFTPPPTNLVNLAASWLRENMDLCGANGQAENQGVVTMLGRSPVSGLLTWTILSPLFAEAEGLSYSKLHFTLLQHITEENLEFSIPGGYLSNLTESLLSTLNLRAFPETSINKSLDRFGQMLQASRAAKCRIEEDLVLLINQLPDNRLISIIINNIS